MSDKTEFLDLLPPVLLNTHLFSVEQLWGGASGETYKLGFNPAAPDYWVLKKYGKSNLSSNAYLPDTESELLAFLHQQGFSVPEPHPINGPYLLTRYIPHVQAEVVARKLAENLARIHRLAVPPDVQTNLQFSDSPLNANACALLHGDYWPGNLLIHTNHSIVTLDWEDALWGDPVSEFSKSRVELYGLRGRQDMLTFTKEYKKHQPYLDYERLSGWDHLHILSLKQQVPFWPMNTRDKQNYLKNLAQFESESE